MQRYDPYSRQEFQLRHLGTGMQVPNIFHPTTGRVISNVGLARIRQSIAMILLTPIGSRFFMPEFGSNLHKILFDPNDPMTAEMAQFHIREALERWEKRIDLSDIRVFPDPSSHEMLIHISYSIAGTNINDTFIFPFDKGFNRWRERT